MSEPDNKMSPVLTNWTSTFYPASDFLTSISTEKLDAALAKAQGEMKNAVKSKENPFFKSKYADLADVWDACRQALSKHGLSITQWPVSSADGSLHLVTRIGCGGEWMLSRSSVPVPKQDPQGYGSALSYLRRYALSALLGIATEDDDGAAATESGKAPKPAAKKARHAEAGDPQGGNEPEPIFGERQKEIMDLPAALGLTVEQAQEVWKDVVGTNAGIVDATPENLDQFEMALRGTSEAQAAAFGTEQK